LDCFFFLFGELGAGVGVCVGFEEGGSGSSIVCCGVFLCRIVCWIVEEWGIPAGR
jgi:hypothetical protein